MSERGRDIDRLVRKLRAVWRTRNQQRLGQLLLNITRFEAGEQEENLFQVSDQVLERAMDKIIGQDKAEAISKLDEQPQRKREHKPLRPKGAMEDDE